jgi:hypothetical protein
MLPVTVVLRLFAPTDKLTNPNTTFPDPLSDPTALVEITKLIKIVPSFSTAAFPCDD